MVASILDIPSIPPDLARFIQEKIEGNPFYLEEMINAFYKAIDYLMKALDIGERTDNRDVLAYACGCLVWTCTDMGMLDKAVAYGRRAEALLPQMETDQELVRIILTGTGIAHGFRGAVCQCQSVGRMLQAHGEKGADIRSKSDGYLVCAMGHFASGNFNQSIEFCNMAIASSAKRVHSFNSKFLPAYTYLTIEQVDEAEAILYVSLSLPRTTGMNTSGVPHRPWPGWSRWPGETFDAGFVPSLGRWRHFGPLGRTITS